MGSGNDPLARDRWARLRFSIVGPLMAAPPKAGEFQAIWSALAAKVWRHPISGLDVRFGASTIQRWYYKARKAYDGGDTAAAAARQGRAIYESVAHRH